MIFADVGGLLVFLLFHVGGWETDHCMEGRDGSFFR
jgi:hypothetical protein